MTLPVADRSESALLGAILTDPGAIEEVEGLVTPEMFASADREAVYRVVLHVRRKWKREVNFTTVSEGCERLKRPELVSVLLDLTGSIFGGSVADLVTEVRLAHQRREMARACVELAQRGADPSLAHGDYVAEVEARIASIANATRITNDGLRKLDPGTAYRAIEEAIRSKGRVNQTTTMREVDAITGGLGNGHVLVVGGFPGDGKTGIAIQIIEDVAVKRGKVAAFFSLEMPEEDIAKRLLSLGSKVKLASMRSGQLDATQIEAMDAPLAQLKIAPVFIYDKPEPTIGTIRAESRRLKARHGEVGVIVIDYLQLARGTTRTDSREQEVAEVSRGAKALAKEIGCPVVALAQLNADGVKRPNMRPRASDLRESKAIWQDADVIALIFNPNRDAILAGTKSDDGERIIIIDKNRHGPRGEARVIFNKNTATFTNEGGDLVPWPTTTKAPHYTEGAPDDRDGDGSPWGDDDFDADRRFPS
jgi:replicative DNA helicase